MCTYLIYFQLPGMFGLFFGICAYQPQKQPNTAWTWYVLVRSITHLDLLRAYLNLHGLRIKSPLIFQTYCTINILPLECMLKLKPGLLTPKRCFLRIFVIWSLVHFILKSSTENWNSRNFSSRMSRHFIGKISKLTLLTWINWFW